MKMIFLFIRSESPSSFFQSSCVLANPKLMPNKWNSNVFWFSVPFMRFLGIKRKKKEKRKRPNATSVWSAEQHTHTHAGIRGPPRRRYRHCLPYRSPDKTNNERKEKKNHWATLTERDQLTGGLRVRAILSTTERDDRTRCILRPSIALHSCVRCLSLSPSYSLSWHISVYYSYPFSFI